MSAKITPVFIFSLPRSGSTLLQRMISTGGEIATASEPWLLLPVLSYRNNEGVFADYSHYHALMGVEDFSENLSDKSFLDCEIKKAILNVYHDAAAGKEFFLDKTPRYTLICSDIYAVFGDEAHYIFLWRHPLSIAKSMYKSWRHWNKGMWNIGSFKTDFVKGFSQAIELSKRVDGSVTVKYEDLVSNPESVLATISDKTGLANQFNIEEIDVVASSKLKGRLGDSSGIEKYSSVTNKPTDEWLEVFNNPVRVWWGRLLVKKWVGRDSMEYMGYDYTSTLSKLSYKRSVKGMFSFDFMKDCCSTAYYLLYWRLQFHVLVGKDKAKYPLR